MSAKVLPTVRDAGHAMEMRTDDGYEAILVAGGPLRAYLWIGDKQGYLHTTITGEKALRALAAAILKELDTPRKRRK